ncbi:MAG: right-handed parallel beta-helix repeat-containing protein [Gemmatimonadaceae bacterium]|nr:right-handed parallel beta-helix repeat-containing protein [Gemmatimonadaceae bacterium]
MLPVQAIVASVLLFGIPASETVPSETPLRPSGPITITVGGTYTGHWVSTGSTPAVSIRTMEPVTIKDSFVTNLNDGTLIHSDVGLASNVTLEGVTAKGGSGRFFAGEGIKSLVIRRSTILKTGGIYVLKTQPGGVISITRNRQRDVQGTAGLRQFVQLNQVTTAAVDISWNEIINVFGRSRVEDNINLFRSAFAKVHDNYIHGAYPSTAAEGYAGSGIMVDAGSHDNEIYSNQIVDTTNAGIGIAGGYNNTVRDNRLIFDGRLWTGEKLAGANVGVFVWNAGRDPNWANNQAFGNHVGWVNARGARNDWWLPHCSGRCSNVRQSGTVGRVSEFAEYLGWLRKRVANRATIGA